MNYYVVSPNVWNDGEIKSHIDFMCRSHVVCMGWDKDRKHGWDFANKIQTGDCVIVAQKKNWQWTVFFAGIVDGPAKYGDENGEHYTMCRDIRAFVDLRDSSIIKFREGMTGYAKRNPGSLFQLHKENAVDADFIMGIDKLLTNTSKQLSFTIKEISNWRTNGRVAIPSLQRGLVWNPNQVELLWDSILRGFPIGAFVFSDADKASQQRTSKTHEDAECFLLDGQQRANAISLAFDADEPSTQTRLWVDLKPDMPTTRRFMVKATTKSHPWGYKNNDDCGILPVSEIREAIQQFTQKSFSEIKSIDVSELNLMETWPVQAGCPIPLPTILRYFDFHGCEYKLFRGKIYEWLRSKENISGKCSDGVIDVGIEGEIKKWHSALGEMSKYRISANVLPQRTIEAEDGDVREEEGSNLESLFTRLNTLGTKISPYDLRYSAIKAYWGGLKEENDRVAQTIMPGANLAIFAFRLALSIAAENTKKEGVFAKLADVPTISRIRKLGIGKDLNEVDNHTRSIILNELYTGRLEQIINDIESALGVYKKGSTDFSGLPPFLRTSIISQSPEVYLLLMVLAYRKVLTYISRNAICALATYIQWMSIGPKKAVVDEIYEQLQHNGFSEECLRKAVGNLIGAKLCPLIKFELGVDREGNVSPVWSLPLHSDFYSRVKYNKELLIFAEREYFNKNFKYDPSRIDLNAGHNKPWDYDHIVPQIWTSNKKVGDFRQNCKYWTWTIGNYAAIPFSINRSKNSQEEWDEYLEHAKELLFDKRVSQIKSWFVRDNDQARLFFEITSQRLERIYSLWRDFVINAMSLPDNMDIVEAQAEQEP